VRHRTWVFLVASVLAVGALLLTGAWNLTSAFDRQMTLSGTADQPAVLPAWSPITSSPGPTLGAGPMTFDASDGYVLLYDVVGPFLHGLTCTDQQLWKFVHGMWSQLSVTSAPRFDSALLAYDAAAKYVVLFGGCGTDSNQTWTYAGGVWKNVTTSVAPPAREATGLVYDPTIQAVVLFGGYVYFNLTNGAGYRANDTWEFQGGSWRNVTPAPAPPVRDLLGMAPDSTAGDVVLFGGEGGEHQGATGRGCCLALGDTWTFDGGAWHNASTGVHPSPRASPAFSDDPAAGASILFGGQGAGLGGFAATGPLLNDTWRFSAGRWQNLTMGGNPPARAGADLVCDPVDGYLVLFGGEGPTALLNDTWVVNANLGAASSSSGTSGTPWFYGGVATVGVAAAVLAVLLVLRRRTHKQPPAENGRP
jgi:hypothetical protein